MTISKTRRSAFGSEHQIKKVHKTSIPENGIFHS